MRRRNRALFNAFGVVAIACWLVMIGVLVKRVHFNGDPDGMEQTAGAVSIDSSQREWKEIYLKDKKVGYAVNLIRPFKNGYFIQEEIFLKLNLMGLGSGVYTLTQSQVDEAFLLRSFTFRMTSGVVRFNVSGRVEDGTLLLEMGRGKEQRKRRIPMSKPPMIGAGMSHFLKSHKIRVGEVFRLPLFDPATMAQQEVIVRVTRKEPLNINRITYDTFRLEADLWGKTVTFWLDEEGETLKEEGFMGLSTIRSSAARASRDIASGDEADFYDMTAVPVDKVLNDPERMTYLKLTAHGIDPAFLKPDIWDGKRQSFHDGVLEIVKEKRPVTARYQLHRGENDREMKAFLEPEFNIESDDQKIIEKAREIIGSDRDPIAVTGKLLDWVYQNIEKRPVLSVPSALEVLRTGVGDCNEHATLLTALLRASGIPARLSIGLVYTRQKFFYHAWTEAYVGEWVSLDATMNQMPVDATHIKLVEGNLDKQVDIAGVVGTLKLEVLACRYD